MTPPNRSVHTKGLSIYINFVYDIGLGTVFLICPTDVVRFTVGAFVDNQAVVRVFPRPVGGVIDHRITHQYRFAL